MLGHDARKGLLVHFLNAVLQPEPDRRVQEIEILNPFNEREFESDKLSVVDVKARDVQNDGTRSKFNWRSMRSYRSGCSIRGARGIMGCCVKAKISPPAAGGGDLAAGQERQEKTTLALLKQAGSHPDQPPGL